MFDFGFGFCFLVLTSINSLPRGGPRKAREGSTESRKPPMKRGVCDDHRYSRIVPDSPDMSPPSREFNEWREPSGLLLGALENAIRAADDALEDLSTAPLRREAVRTARRELKSVRAIAGLSSSA